MQLEGKISSSSYRSRGGAKRRELNRQKDHYFNPLSNLKVNTLRCPVLCRSILSNGQAGSSQQRQGMTLGIERDWIEDVLNADPEDPTFELGEHRLSL